jgi:hypothetical protein
MQNTATAEYQPTGDFAYIIEFARKNRDRIVQMHRDAGHEVIAHFAEYNHLWYIVLTDGRPTHLITSGGMTGEGYEYRIGQTVSEYARFSALRDAVTHVSRYF